MGDGHFRRTLAALRSARTAQPGVELPQPETVLAFGALHAVDGFDEGPTQHVVAGRTAMPRPSRRLLILSGLAAGLAGWTKNEGLMFLVALPVARAWWSAVATVCDRPPARSASGSSACCPCWPSLPYRKCALPAATIWWPARACATLARLCDVSRHARVAADFLVTFVRCTAPAVVVLPIAFLAARRGQGSLAAPAGGPDSSSYRGGEAARGHWSLRQRLLCGTR